MNCKTIQPLLSEYIDNVLSARDTWEVDKHLSECNPCAGALNELRRTVGLLAEAPRFEVSVNFMEKLQSRIAVIEPQPPRMAWFSGLREMFRPRVLPAWGAAVGACGLAVFFLASRPIVEIDRTPSPHGPSIAQTARNQSVALAASNPLGDPAAAALVASNTSNTLNIQDGGEPATTTQ